MYKPIPDSYDITFMDVYMYFRKSLLNRKKDKKIICPTVTMGDILKVAKSDYFDPKYKNNRDRLYSFRNYGVHNSRRLKIEKICSRLGI